MSKDHLTRSYRAPSTISVLLETVTFPDGNATSCPDPSSVSSGISSPVAKRRGQTEAPVFQQKINDK